MTRALDRSDISHLLDDEPALKQALIDAAMERNTNKIDLITDKLAQLGRCRRRGDESRLADERARLATSGVAR